jgi:lysozyme
VVVLAVFRKASVNGIKGNVDVNIYNGDLQQLRYITVE